MSKLSGITEDQYAKIIKPIKTTCGWQIPFFYKKNYCHRCTFPVPNAYILYDEYGKFPHLKDRAYVFLDGETSACDKQTKCHYCYITEDDDVWQSVADTMS